MLRPDAFGVPEAYPHAFGVPEAGADPDAFDASGPAPGEDRC